MLNKINHSPLLAAINCHCKNTPDKVALIQGNISVTYKDLANNIVLYAEFLQSAGLVNGDTILLAASKEVEMVYAYFASHMLGIVNVVVDGTLPADRLEYIKSKTSPKLLLGVGSSIRESISALKVNCSSLKLHNLTENDIADVMFTTGTTGQPKGVCLSHANIYGSAKNINGFIGNNSKDIEVLGLPLSHSFGLGRLRCTLLAGGTLVLLGNFANLKKFFDAIEQHHATGFGMVPAVWQYIKRFSGTRIGKYASQIRYIEIGSASLDIADKRLLMELFPSTRICMHYGLTEASRAFFMEFHENKDNLSTIGTPTSNEVHAMIYGEDNEICVKGNMVMKSYLDEKDNENAFVDGFFRTGDCGSCDSQGFYYLTGRVKEIINIGGKKVNPATIEDALREAGASDCAVIAIPDPKGVLGEVPMAFVVKGNKTLSQIKEGLTSLLEPYQIPVSWQEIKVIPRTSSGKIQRLSLKEKIKI